MLDNQFREFLEQAGKFTQNAINSRVAKANAAERILGCSLDSVVSDDDKMYDSLVELQKHEEVCLLPLQTIFLRMSTQQSSAWQSVH